MRKNMFQLLEDEYNIGEELTRLYYLARLDYYFTNTISSTIIKHQIEPYVNEQFFDSWVYRGTCTSVYNMKRALKLDMEEIDLIQLLLYIEYILNIFYLCINNNVIIRDKSNNENKNISLYKNIKILLSNYNFEYKVIDAENTKIVVVESNPSATLVAETIEDHNISLDVIRYNHFMLRGNVHEKKKILTQLYKEFEKIKNQLIVVDKGLASNLGFLFNALGIRHNKHNSPITNELVKAMSDEEIEEWCDDIYEIFMLAILRVNYDNLKDKIEWLKTGD